MDRAGNTLAEARNWRLGATPKSVRDSVSPKDNNDYYRVRLKQKSRLELTLSKLEANANLDLLSHKGKRIDRSRNRGTRDEQIKKRLAAGTYYVRVYPKNKAKTSYRLTGAAIALGNSFSIEFDYRFDSTNWFTRERRAVLKQAAKVWTRIIRDKFETVPAGTPVSMTNPTTGASESFSLDRPIDDLLVFVGVGQSGGALAVGGPFGRWTVGSSLDTRYNGNNFEPWTGDISFNPTANWFFDATPKTDDDIPRNAHDFLSVAVHELGHVLGIGTSKAFDRLVSSGQFTGANARSFNGGAPIPLDGSAGHIQDGFVPSGQMGEPAMDPTLTVGTRKLPTLVDIALLNDIGYAVNYAKAAENTRPARIFSSPSVSSPSVRICGCSRCLMASAPSHAGTVERRTAPLMAAVPLATTPSAPMLLSPALPPIAAGNFGFSSSSIRFPSTPRRDGEWGDRPAFFSRLEPGQARLTLRTRPRSMKRRSEDSLSEASNWLLEEAAAAEA
jgi:hypothetical protein